MAFSGALAPVCPPHPPTPKTLLSPSRVHLAIMAAGNTAAVMLLLIVMCAVASAQDCWAIETDLKYNIPQGVYGTYGGCFKGTKSADGQTCNTNTMAQATRTEGVFGSLSACCDQVESRTRIDPRNGQPRTDQANVKSVCNSYKKPEAAAPAAIGSECFAIETDLKYNIPQGVYGTYGGCFKGTKSADGQTCNTNTMAQGRRTEGVFGSLSACCNQVESRTRIDPRNSQPRTDQANVKSVCNSYKKPQQAAAPAPAPAPAQTKKAGDGSSRTYYIFKSFDLLPTYYVDVWSSGASYARVCGGKEAVARECNKNESCNAFTFGAESDCGYLKRKYFSSPDEPLLFKNEGRGWDTYVSELIIPKARGGALDCAQLQKPAHPLLEEVCSIKQALPQVSGSMYA